MALTRASAFCRASFAFVSDQSAWQFAYPAWLGLDGESFWHAVGALLTLLAAHLRVAKQRGSNRVAWIGGLTTGALDELTVAWLRALGSDRRPLGRVEGVRYGRRCTQPLHPIDYPGFACCWRGAALIV